MTVIYKPKRGNLESLKENISNLRNHELFYITDLNMLGITNSKGEPQLLVKIVQHDTREDFPENPKIGVLYFSRQDNLVYYYDIAANKYEKTTIIKQEDYPYYLGI